MFVVQSIIPYYTHFRNLESKTRCFFYDKPPRTGSTTIARVLSVCLEKKGYTGLSKPISDYGQDEVVRNMLDKTGTLKSAVLKHVMLSDDDIRLLDTQCEVLFYLTSCRSMKERVASKAKYSMTKKHGNSSLTKEQYSTAIRRAVGDGSTEPELEDYPYTGKGSMRPDYVIRTDDFDDDLGALLRALACDISYTSLNVHMRGKTVISGMTQLDDIALTYDDATFRRLSRLAESGNPVGIDKVKQF